MDFLALTFVIMGGNSAVPQRSRKTKVGHNDFFFHFELFLFHLYKNKIAREAVRRRNSVSVYSSSFDRKLIMYF